MSRGSFFQLPVVIALELGYFRTEGLDVELVEHAAEAGIVQALAGGLSDVASGGFDQVLALHAQGLAYQSFLLHGRAPQHVVGISTRHFPKVVPVAEMRGLRVGVTTIGSTAHMIAEMVLKRGGISPRDMNYVVLGSGSGVLAAVRAGQVEVLCSTDPVITQLEQRGEIRVLADTRNVKGVAQVFGGPVPSGCLFAPTAFVARHPNTVQALANGMMHALKWLQTAGPSDVIRAVPERYLLGDRALYLACFEKMREAISLDGMISADAASLALRAQAGFDASVKPAQIALSGTFTNDFARRAREKFKF